jgi:methylated-DNA-[protein]-cysteine S-methyltransferase
MPQEEADSLFYGVWATAWGPMGAAGGAAGLRRVVLPHYMPDQLAELLAWEHPGAARDEKLFERLIQLTRDYFNGKAVDFGEVACDLPPAGSFAGMVLRACRTIPYGQTRSYSSLAEQIGRPDAARAVAAALGKNPIPLVVPCHRVTYADGRLGGFSAEGGVELKRRMLDLERRATT